MSRDTICSQDAALIAAAIKTGKVTRIPQGKSAYELPTWDENNNRLTEGQSLHWRNTGGETARQRRTDPETAARRVRVREAVLRGDKRKTIAAREGCCVRVISSDIEVLREKGFNI